MQMKALDLFCGAGGASMGIHRAGFHVVGVDSRPQPNYPFEFVQADALKYPLTGFDLIWASPPCQRFMTGGQVRREKAPDLIDPIRKRLQTASAWTIIENVPGAPLRQDVVLCGSMFELQVRRHRIFETSFQVDQPSCRHKEQGSIVGVYGNPHGARGAWPTMLPSTLATWSDAMGIYWMSSKELSQAIPPAYSEHICR